MEKNNNNLTIQVTYIQVKMQSQIDLNYSVTSHAQFNEHDPRFDSQISSETNKNLNQTQDGFQIQLHPTVQNSFNPNLTSQKNDKSRPIIIEPLQWNNHDLKYFFKTVSIKQKKTQNNTKYFVSAFQRQIKRLLSGGLQINQQHHNFLTFAKGIYLKKGRRNINQNALQILFGITLNIQISRKNRQILHTYLGSPEFLEYCNTNKFSADHNRKSQMLSAKIYRLRCQDRRLIGRTQNPGN